MNKTLPIIALVLVLLSGGAGYYFYDQLQVQNEALQSEIAALNVTLDQIEKKQSEEFAQMDKRLDKLEDDDGDDDDDDKK